jgi:cytohesin
MRVLLGSILVAVMAMAGGCRRAASSVDQAHTAILKHDILGLQQYLDAGGDVDAQVYLEKPSGGQSLLHLAAQEGQLEMVALLIRAGANVDQADGSRETPLFAAIGATRTPAQDRIVDVLLDAGADPTLVNEQKETPLHRAAGLARADAVQRLLEAGADPNALASHGVSPLHDVADGSSPDAERVLVLLLDAGADPNLRRGGVGSAIEHWKRRGAAALLAQYEQWRTDTAERDAGPASTTASTTRPS